MYDSSGEKGFSVVELLIIIAALALALGAGILVHQHSHKAKTGASTANKAATMQTTKQSTAPAPNPMPSQTVSWLTYSNQQAGLTFKYPSTWTSHVTPNSSYTTGSDFAAVSGTLTSPSGNTLYWIYQEIGGKGDAECTPAASDTAFSPSDKCASKQIYSVQQIPSAKPVKANAGRSLFEDSLYITETKYYNPGGTGDPVSKKHSSGPMYQICLDPYFKPEVINGVNTNPQPKVGTEMGFELPCNWWDTGFNVTFPVAGQNDFNSADAKTAIQIMKSFNSL